MELVPKKLREPKTNEDFMYQGDLVTVKLGSCQHDGIQIRFVVKVDIPGDMPQAFAGMLGLTRDNDGNAEKTIVTRHVHRKWYDKFIGITLESRVRKDIKEVKSLFESVKMAERLAQEIQDNL